jgi:hypothetical protein
VLIIGSSFIATEVASGLANTYKDKLKITMITCDEAPFANILGEQIGNMFV